MKPMLDDRLLEEYMLGFYGHGNLKGAYWFIGMEHGGGDSFEDVKRRIEMWAALGKGAVTDLARYCRGIGEGFYFQEPVKNQPTWNKLIRALLCAAGDEHVTLSRVKTYQARKLGRSDGDTCLLELLPLANPSLGHWLYDTHSRLPYLKNRDAYRSHLMLPRAERLKQLIGEYTPRLAHFYGTSYADWWRKIADVPFTRREADSRAFFYGRQRDTVFLMTEHATAFGVTIKYFHDVGSFVAGLA